MKTLSILVIFLFLLSGCACRIYMVNIHNEAGATTDFSVSIKADLDKDISLKSDIAAEANIEEPSILPGL
jgi:cell division protein FtsX